MRQLCLILLLLCSPADADALNPPVRVSLHKLNRAEVSGLVTSYDDHGLEILTAKKQTVTVAWDEMDAANVLSVYERLLGRGKADQWMDVAKRLLKMKNGAVPAKKAFARAVRLDETLKEKADRLLSGEQDEPQTRPTASATRPAEEPSPFHWRKLTPDQQAAALREQKLFAQKVAVEMSIRLQPFETEHYLFFSELAPTESARWASQLDALYARLANLFGIDPRENIWRGKAVVFVFSQREQYLKFEQQFFHFDATGSGGVCNSAANGDVRIAFFRDQDDHWFAHVLVHESTHGFLHRYRSPVDVKSWANEGLADYVAEQLVPHPGLKAASDAQARAELQARQDLGDFFTTDRIPNWQYPIARTMTEFMIRTNEKGYVNFINGIKDGIEVEESLKNAFGAGEEKLLAAYAQAMGLNGVKASGVESKKD